MISKLILIFLGILILPDLYIYFTFIHRLQGNIFLRLAYFLPTVLLLFGMGWAIHTMGQGAGNTEMIEIQRYIWILFLFTIPKLFFFLMSLIGIPFVRWMHVPATVFNGAGLLLGAMAILLLVYGYTWGRSNLETVEVTFRSKELPDSFRGFRIVQLSDLHLGSSIGREKDLEKLVEKVNSLRPDLIVFTGDLVNSRADETDTFRDILSQLQAPHGLYSIMGNHDYGTYHRWKSPKEQVLNLHAVQRYQKEMGWTLLNNSHVFLHEGPDSIALIGCENWGEPPFSQFGDLEKAMKGTEDIPFRILLTHNPKHWLAEVVPNSDIQLTLSGHTHAMQLRAGKHSPSSFIYPEWGGMYSEGNQSLYVNIGIGITLLPIRLGARPEITLFTLEK